MGSHIIAEDEYTCPNCGGRLICNSIKEDRECTSCGEIISGIGYSMVMGVGQYHIGGKKENKKDKTWDEHDFDRACSKIGQMRSILSLTKPIQDDAIKSFEIVLKKKLIAGRSFDVIIAALIYISCKRNNLPRPATEIAEAMEVNRTSMIRMVKFLKKELRIRLGITGPEHYAQRYCFELNLPLDVSGTALRIIAKSKDIGLISGRDPTCIAAAAVYMSSNMHKADVTQKRIAEVTGVTETTIRKRCKELEDALGINMYANGSLQKL